ncbi:hypothetical protein LINPERHAP1_LOCUS4104 [Linum perenne]
MLTAASWSRTRPILDPALLCERNSEVLLSHCLLKVPSSFQTPHSKGFQPSPTL